MTTNDLLWKSREAREAAQRRAEAIDAEEARRAHVRAAHERATAQEWERIRAPKD